MSHTPATTGLCFGCAAALDSLRAPVVAVVAGRVVPFCSRKCRLASLVERDSLAPPAATTSALELPVSAPTAPTLLAGPAPIELAEPTPTRIALPTPEPRPARPSSRTMRALGYGTVVAAIVAALEWAVPTRSSIADGDTIPTPPVVIAPVMMVPPRAPPPPVAPASIRVHALAVLAAELAEPSPGLALRAAIALAGLDPHADAVLLARTTDVWSATRIEAASALASAGEATGLAALHAVLSAPQLDARIEAASALAMLGDSHGEELLRSVVVDNPRSRLGAAEALVRLGDTQAMAILKATLAGADSDERTRAAVALGELGDVEAHPVLAEVLAHNPDRLDAALALLHLGDPAGAPLAWRSLAIPCLRVEGATVLQATGLAIPDATLRELDAALTTEDDAGRISAAAAIVRLVPQIGAPSSPRGAR